MKDEDCMKPYYSIELCKFSSLEWVVRIIVLCVIIFYVWAVVYVVPEEFWKMVDIIKSYYYFTMDKLI